MTDSPKRKGARRINEIPPDVLAQLNRGELATANLVEWLALDQRLLLQAVLPELGLQAAIPATLAAIARLKKPSAAQLIPVIGRALLPVVKAQAKRKSSFAGLAAHPSDVVRSWACHVVGGDAELPLAQKLDAIRPFAADAHFGVREIAWMAVRDALARELSAAIRGLSAWATDADENIRRFASEATRPRGVWCKHIDALKKNPELGYPILEPLHSDPAKYVRDSVANWLNDASKSQPGWVEDVCTHWAETSPTKETAYIVNKALRTIRKG
ncbi:MAG: DNA alkylation repair protein [Acidobacteria bacterium]|nr:DNA alkylation repair protein [Acidobacteriota bacterium]MBI3423398.1 DNA alkylation repair protein [Acidobacteriota bacterium]